MIASTFRTAVVRIPGGPDSIEIIDVPLVAPGPGEVRVEIAAAPVNPVDLAVAGGVFHGMGLINQPERTGLGWDFAGPVAATGPGVELAIGTRVAGMVGGFDRDFGTYAEQLVVPAADVAIVPDGLDLVAASTVPLNGLTAAQILDLLGDAPARWPAAGDRRGRGGRRICRPARAEPRLAGDGSGQGAGRGVRPRPWRRLHHTRRAWLGRCRRWRGAAGASSRPGPRRRGVRGCEAERRACCGARDRHTTPWLRTPTALDWPSYSTAPRQVSCRPACTRSCRWTRSPTPIGPWPRAGCAAATCSRRERLVIIRRP